MPTSKEAATQYSPPLILPSIQEHKRTLVILHGRGSTAQNFAEPLLQHAVSSLSTSSSIGTNLKSFRDRLPHTKFVFPTASLRRAVAFNRSFTHQWFDTWSLTQPEFRQHLQIKGLYETTEYIHDLLQNEIDFVGPKNVVLMGLSQGCAASIVATMLWRGEPFGAVVGMCGYLPFQKDIRIDVEQPENDFADSEGMFGEGDAEDIFERPSEEHDERSRLEMAIEWLREQLEFEDAGELDATAPPIASIPVFMGHGRDDEKVLVEHGRLAADLLELMDVPVTWKEYENLGHWYSGAMLRDVVQFLQNLKGWEPAT